MGRQHGSMGSTNKHTGHGSSLRNKHRFYDDNILLGRFIRSVVAYLMPSVQPNNVKQWFEQRLDLMRIPMAPKFLEKKTSRTPHQNLLDNVPSYHTLAIAERYLLVRFVLNSAEDAKVSTNLNVHTNTKLQDRVNHVNRLPVYPASANYSQKFSHIYHNKEKKLLSPAMLLYYLAAVLKGVHQPRSDDDFVDRLNYHYTSGIIFAFAIVVSAKQYVGYPIQCWVPAQFTDAWEQYTENYCWVQSTYFIPMSESPVPYFRRPGPPTRHVGYYQWVPFVLCLEALMFYVPCMLWRAGSQWNSGITLNAISQMAVDARFMDGDTRSGIVNAIAAHIEDSISLERDISGSGSKPTSGLKASSCIQCICFRGNCGNYLTVLYIISKAFYVVNVATQIFILNTFLGTKDLLYGFHILVDLARGRDWAQSGNFPRVTLCDFDVRVLGNVQRHTVQCVLMINLFNEKIFLFLWFWFFLVRVLGNVQRHTVQCVLMINLFNEKIFLFLWFWFFLVTIITLCSFMHWIMLAVIPGQHEQFLRRYLRAADFVIESASMHKFIHKFLGSDGVFCLRMISRHAGDIITTQIVADMWRDFYDQGRRSPIDMYDPSALGGPPSPSSEEELNFKNWLLGGGRSGGGGPHFESGNAAPSAARSMHRRRKSETFLGHVMNYQKSSFHLCAPDPARHRTDSDASNLQNNALLSPEECVKYVSAVSTSFAFIRI